MRGGFSLEKFGMGIGRGNIRAVQQVIHAGVIKIRQMQEYRDRNIDLTQFVIRVSRLTNTKNLSYIFLIQSFFVS